MSSAAATSFDIVAYCVMPDHIHIFALGRKDTADLLVFVKHFKQATSFHHKKLHGTALWQQS